MMDVSTHSRLKAAGAAKHPADYPVVVSTHSRLKAAGKSQRRNKIKLKSFNTQPPKGGWVRQPALSCLYRGCFNTQPPKGGWTMPPAWLSIWRCFNTQPPKGGWRRLPRTAFIGACFNTQPPKGGWFLKNKGILLYINVSTHSRLKAAGRSAIMSLRLRSCFNTQPPKGGWLWIIYFFEA